MNSQSIVFILVIHRRFLMLLFYCDIFIKIFSESFFSVPSLRNSSSALLTFCGACRARRPWQMGMQLVRKQSDLLQALTASRFS